MTIERHLSEISVGYSSAIAMIVFGLTTLRYVAYRLDVFDDLARAIARPN